jgi:[FeFe] hydrogenase (group B1/B3)
MIIRRELLTRIASLYKEGTLDRQIDRIPLEISKRISDANDRCCVHKMRAVAKYKIMAILGFGKKEETDELATLSEYLQIASNDNYKANRFLTVAEEACTSCVKSSYVVTNLCKGCIAHPCVLNCPKKAIYRNSKGKAEIDPKLCVNCGICKDLCPYHSIIYMPVPCEEACPVNAIRKDENGIEHIDEAKCILCGKCVNACPFGSIMETTSLLHLMNAVSNNKQLIAITAPSITGQFSATNAKIAGAIKQLGFSEVYDASIGAETTTRNEVKELAEVIKNGSFLFTSCCPSWILTSQKHLPELRDKVSHTLSPMAYTARFCKENYPDHKIVFIGPCIAKRKECADNPYIDFALTFEELGCWFDGWNISPDESPDTNFHASSFTQAYAMSGGVSNCVSKSLPECNSVLIDGLNKKSIRQLKNCAKENNSDISFIEVMCCEGGCIAGSSVHNFPKDAIKVFHKKRMCD